MRVDVCAYVLDIISKSLASKEYDSEPMGTATRERLIKERGERPVCLVSIAMLAAAEGFKRGNFVGIVPDMFGTNVCIEP